MSKKKVLFIINPVANHGEVKKYIPFIKDFFQNKFQCNFIETKKPKEAIEISKNIHDFEYVFSVGGDGTAHEIVNGLALSNNKKTILGLIPAGSGNDYCHALKISRKVKKACRQLIKANIKYVDLGLVNGIYFANSLGIGFDARVAHLANQIKNEVNKTGLSLYYEALSRILKSDFYCHHINYQIENGSWIEREILLLAVTNGPSYGGGYKITPQAINDDGQLDVCLIDPLKKNQVKIRLPFVVLGRHHWMRQEHHFRIKKINIQSDNELPAHLDGELMLSASFSIEVVTKALKVLTGRT